MRQLEKSFYSKTSMYAFFVTLLLFMSMWISTDQFTDIDMALLGYMISSFIFAIGLTIRMASWLIRPATHQVVKRSLKNLKTKNRTKRNFRSILKTAIDNIILQKFIFKRGIYRGVQHFMIAWGCIGSFAITFGLTFGWMRFDLIDPNTYQIIVFNMPTIKLAAHGFIAELVYNGLNITAIMVMIGVCMALFRRVKSQDVKVAQRVEFDLFPLYLLLSVTLTGLLLTVSYAFLDGWMHPYLTLIHQVTVVILLVYFPFGKLFHLPIRPLATAVPMNYQEVIKVDTRACKKCGTTYSSDDQITDVKEILAAQSFDLQLADGSYLADYCPACRRRIRVMKQMNMEAPQGNPYDPISTMNDIHMSGFGKKRSDDFYHLPKEQQKEEREEEEIVK
ncbi:MFS transporter [Fredinandcohnia quinoae]|uniref:MFS transporter n=1 Tax=Fredinandcohnia quinoae TaxID=2918902 RepID=A0AAW5E1W8_9BACI|nr:MFS transporter [Fredinandcohnia sp. SECRCQ15]MCH1626338.1 MFS transporter [Fredinandcohnia sp. SECRCQ15]